MSGKKVEVQIINPADLTGNLYSRLSHTPEHMLTDSGKIYLLLDHTVLCAEDSPEGNELICSVMDGRRLTLPCGREKEDLLFRIIRNPYLAVDEASFRKLGIDPERRRCAAVFTSSVTLSSDLYTAFSGIAPSEKGDITVPLDYRTVLFVKDMEKHSYDEMIEFTQAVIDTMEGEGITGICAGIGREASGFYRIRDSYGEAQSALSVGMRFRGNDRVYVYTELALERIIETIPADARLKIREDYLRHGSSFRMTEELLETVRVFFQNDLNLTASARQLFIHRNTLNYRLDKIKRETGLDLRSFNDAVIFRILSGFPEE